MQRLITLIFALTLASLSLQAQKLDDLFLNYTRHRGQTRDDAAKQIFRQTWILELFDTTAVVNLDDPDQRNFFANYCMAEYRFSQNRFSESAELCQQALKYDNKHIDIHSRSDCWFLLSSAQSRLGNLGAAAEALKNTHALDLQIQDKARISSTQNNLAALYYEMKQYKTAEAYNMKAIKTESEISKTSDALAIRYGMAAEIYTQLADPLRAIEFAKKAYEINRNNKSIVKAAVRLSQMAEAEMSMRRYSDAKKHLDEALPILLADKGATYSVSVVFCQLAEIAEAEGRTDEAITLYKKSQTICQDIGNKLVEMRVCKGLWRTLRKTDNGQALASLERYAKLADSIQQKTTMTEMSELRNELEAQEFEHEAERQRAQKNGLIAFAIFTVLLLIGTIVYTRRKIKEVAAKASVQAVSNLNNESTINAHALETSATEETQKGPEAEFIVKFEEAVKAAMRSREISVEQIASNLCITSSQLRRRLQAITNETPAAYIQRLRIEDAMNYLKAEPDTPIAEIGERIGFEDNAHFSRVFKQQTGKTPSEYRRETQASEKPEKANLDISNTE